MPFGKILILLFVFLFGSATPARWAAAAGSYAGFAGQNQDSSSQSPGKADLGRVGRNRDTNAVLLPPAAGENRVVFFGDSITALWRLAVYFSNKPYINSGISGQTTPQMLARFRQDVIDLHPKLVVVLAGINDIATIPDPRPTRTSRPTTHPWPNWRELMVFASRFRQYCPSTATRRSRKIP